MQNSECKIRHWPDKHHSIYRLTIHTVGLHWAAEQKFKQLCLHMGCATSKNSSHQTLAHIVQGQIQLHKSVRVILSACSLTIIFTGLTKQIFLLLWHLYINSCCSFLVSYCVCYHHINSTNCNTYSISALQFPGVVHGGRSRWCDAWLPSLGRAHHRAPGQGVHAHPRDV